MVYGEDSDGSNNSDGHSNGSLYVISDAKPRSVKEEEAICTYKGAY